MGLSITLDIGDDPHLSEQDLSVINEALAEHGVAYTPGSVDAKKVKAASAIGEFRHYGSISCPYSFLHYLRRFAVRFRLDQAWTPEPIGDPDDDEVYATFAEEYFDTSTLETFHLVCHGDCEGYYVPCDFERVIVGRSVPGRLLGSSVRLMDELLAVGPKLGLSWTSKRPSKAEVKRQFDEAEEEEGFWHEKLVWMALHDMARLSVQFQRAIVFR